MDNNHTVSTSSYLSSTTAPIFTEEKPLVADKIDKIFALLSYLIGFGFIYVFTSGGLWQMQIYWPIRIFVVAYVLFVLGYFYLKKKHISKVCYFWLVILCCLGAFYSRFGIIHPLIQQIAMIMVAAYFALSAGGNLMEKGHTSQWIFVDGWNTLAALPFGNFICNIKVLGSDGDNLKENRIHRFKMILLGLFITVPILIIALPLLSSADQRFADLLWGFRGIMDGDFLVFVLRFLFSIPVTFYLFGLIYGSIHKRKNTQLQKERVREYTREWHMVPDLAIETALVVTCLVYVLFIGLQGSYIFSAFFGVHPETFTYAEYARRGFFELCQIAVLNLSVLTLANSFSKTTRSENKVLRGMNVVLSVLTILLVITAMSKMLLYISAYGLTEKRVLTMVFMIWLLLIFVMMILWQFKRIQLVRIGFLTGTVFYTLLCVLPVVEWINTFNRAFRYY